MGFEDLASRLQSDIQIIFEDDVYKVKFPLLDNTDAFAEDIYVLEALISGNVIQLYAIDNLLVGDRILIDGIEAYVTAIDVLSRYVTIDRQISNVAIDSLVLRVKSFIFTLK